MLKVDQRGWARVDWVDHPCASAACCVPWGAVSLTRAADGSITLGVHIADVSHFVRAGSALDAEAVARGTSTYFARRVVPMLPEVLSNGVCSLQEGQRRYCKSAFITYDADAKVAATRFAETVITSSKRLTYADAQGICDGKTGGFGRDGAMKSPPCRTDFPPWKWQPPWGWWC